MNEEKIRWCLCQKKGIQIIGIKPHLSKSYMEEAELTLENVFPAKGKWKLITAYYACYNALYSVLMKCGIQCEIHDCTIELMDILGFESEKIKYMRKMKGDRIQAQYYLRDVRLDDEQKVKEFILACKVLLNDLNSAKIEQIRNAISRL